MYNRRGYFGLVPNGELLSPPFLLLDGGIELQTEQSYHFDNADRPGYDGYLFQYTLSGEGCYEKDGVMYPLKKDSCFLISFPENSSYYLPCKQNTDSSCQEGWEFLYLHFSGDAVLAFYEKLVALYSNCFRLTQDGCTMQLVLKYHEKLRNKEKLLSYESNEFLCSFLCSLLRELENGEKNGAASFVQLACDIMEREYAENININTISERLGISAAHFSRVFHKERGQTPMTYLARIRLQNAVYELLNSNHTMEEVALHNGFSTANYFGKVFKKATGMTPAQYRLTR